MKLYSTGFAVHKWLLSGWSNGAEAKCITLHCFNVSFEYASGNSEE